MAKLWLYARISANGIFYVVVFRVPVFVSMRVYGAARARHAPTCTWRSTYPSHFVATTFPNVPSFGLFSMLKIGNVFLPTRIFLCCVKVNEILCSFAPVQTAPTWDGNRIEYSIVVARRIYKWRERDNASDWVHCAPLLCNAFFQAEQKRDPSMVLRASGCCVCGNHLCDREMNDFLGGIKFDVQMK